MSISLSRYIEVLPHFPSYEQHGQVKEVIGLTVTCTGLKARIGELCQIYPNAYAQPVAAEVVGFTGEKLMLMPLGELVSIGPGSLVANTGRPFQVFVGQDLLGRVLNGLGLPLDGRRLVKEVLQPYPTIQKAQNPLKRQRIREPLGTGVRAIDALLTTGRGQRVGIFSGSGVGKSTLLGMIARNTEADVNVIGLVGERGREVREFLEQDLGEDGLARSVVVVATSDQPPLVRMKGALVATTIAEYFREQGRDVMLLIDSVTRFAMAAREVGLASGEPPATRGYPPSVFAELPRLLERSGTSERGSITAFYTVLVDGDDMSEPVADAVRGILDGHVVLERKLAQQGHYPAIDVLQSVSRVMNQIVDKQHLKEAEKVKELLSLYRQNEDLMTIGAYQPGHQPKLDHAVQQYPKLESFLKQEQNEAAGYVQNISQLHALAEEIF